MSKYIVEIKPEYEDSFKGLMILGAKESKLFVDALAVEDMEELNSDYINEHFGDLQDTAYQRGLEDAWEAARRISVIELNGGLNGKELMKIYGTMDIHKIYDDNTASEAIAKLKAYEEKRSDKIKRGDIVNVKGCCNDNLLGVVTKVWNDNCYIVWGDGSGGAWSKDSVVKTGKHIDIDKILEELRYDS